MLRWASRAIPHAGVAILLWLFLAITLQSLHAEPMLAAGGCLTAIALAVSRSRLVALLRRTRWVMLSLLLIYGYATPGEPLWVQMGALTPTQQGLIEGLLQLCRLVFALAGLCILLGLLSRQQLVAGLYSLSYPLRYLGVSRERAAVRLALTLHYAEAGMVEADSAWRRSIERMRSPVEVTCRTLELPTVPLTLRDGLLLLAGAGCLAWALL